MIRLRVGICQLLCSYLHPMESHRVVGQIELPTRTVDPVIFNHVSICACVYPNVPHHALHPDHWVILWPEELIIPPCLCCYFKPRGPVGLGVCVSMFGGGVTELRRLSLPRRCSASLTGQLGWAKLEHGLTQTYLIGGGWHWAFLQLLSDTQMLTRRSRTLRQNLEVPFCFHTSSILLESPIHCWDLIWVRLDYLCRSVVPDTRFDDRESRCGETGWTEEQQIDKNTHTWYQKGKW